MPTRPNQKSRTTRLIPVAVMGSLAALTLAACGSGSAGGSTDSGSTPQATAPSPSGSFGGQRPAASGLIAAVDGTTMQVQSQQAGQTAVTWSDSTKFSHSVTVTISAIKAGSCVTAIAPTGTDQAATSFTATTVTVSAATNGECGRGFGGPGGGNGSGGASGVRPSGAPTGFPSGGPGGTGGGALGFGGIATGKVVSVSGSSVVLDAEAFDLNGGSAAPTTTKKTITIGTDTTVSTQASTTSKSVVAGKCATVQGAADSEGTVTATSVSITDASNGQCTGGFGGRNGNG
jgi:hypothetical protein